MAGQSVNAALDGKCVDQLQLMPDRRYLGRECAMLGLLSIGDMYSAHRQKFPKTKDG